MNKILLIICLATGSFSIPLLKNSDENSQAYGSNGTDTTCFHLNINKLSEKKIIELQTPSLCLDYDDFHGKASTINLKLYDWQHKVLVDTELPKSYGKNSYALNFEQYNIGAGLTYHLVLTNEVNKKLKAYFKLLPEPDMPDPIVDIFVNPILLECKKTEGNLVEFYGNIDGGKPPYDINWVVLGEDQNSVLYQPKNLTIEKAGHTPTLQVDNSPNYYVLLHVKDACGSEGEKVVSIQCKEDSNKANSIFIQPLPDFERKYTPSEL